MYYGSNNRMMNGESASGPATNSGQPGDADSDEGSAMVGAGLADHSSDEDDITGSQIATPGLDDDMDHRADNSGPGL